VKTAKKMSPYQDHNAVIVAGGRRFWPSLKLLGYWQKQPVFEQNRANRRNDARMKRVRPRVSKIAHVDAEVTMFKKFLGRRFVSGES
jgi:hypothetical protein